ncbi:MAG: DUF928 domain-containing protein [Cyanobacteria bacterium J06639_14]
MFLAPKLSIVGLVLLSELSLSIPPSFAQTQLSEEIAQAHPKIDPDDAPTGVDPPEPGTPPGGTQLLLEVGPPPSADPPVSDSEPGGTLSSSDPCNSGTSHVTALVPPDNSFSADYPELADYPLLTISQYPTFVFHVPYESQEIRYGELSIGEWPDEEASRPYSQEFELPQAPGIISVSLSSSSGFALADGKDYIWRLRIYCGSDNSSDYVIVRGTMRKIPATAEAQALVNAYEPEIWYDSIARLAEQFQSPSARSNNTLRTQWFDLLNLLDLEDSDPETFTPELVKTPIILR